MSSTEKGTVEIQDTSQEQEKMDQANIESVKTEFKKKLCSTSYSQYFHSWSVRQLSLFFGCKVHVNVRQHCVCVCRW